MDNILDDSIERVDDQGQEGLLQEGKNGNNPTFTVFENGERVTFEITEEMYDAMKPTTGILSSTFKPLTWANNSRRNLITQYNPLFMITNPIKDLQDVLINSQHSAKTYASLPKSCHEIRTKGKWYSEYMENGGWQNSYFDTQSNTFKKENKVIEFAKKYSGLNAIERLNNTIELAPRLAEYIVSRESGRSIDVSMLDAARVTTNFTAGGDVTKFANRNGVTFLNASVQGAMQNVRNIREAKMNGLKGWANLAGKFAVAGIPAYILNNLFWDDDEEYEELSDYVKENYYILGKYEDGKFVRVPKGRTLAVIQDAINQIANAATGDDEVDLESFIELVISNLAPNNPLDNNIFAPILQVARNETWYGDDLVPSRLQDLPDAEQFDESTDSISKWLGETFDVSPYKTNYLLDQYSGFIGDIVLPMITPKAESGDDSKIGKLFAPLRDKFATDSVLNNQNVSDFYDAKDELAKVANSSNATDEDVLRYKYFNSVNAEMSNLYKAKREIQNSDLSDSEKYRQVREIQNQINEMSEEAIATYGGVRVSGNYGIVGDRHYHLEDGEWKKINDKQLKKQKEITKYFAIGADEYWENKKEWDFAYEYPGKYAVAKTCNGFTAYQTHSVYLNNLESDKDSDGNSISGSRKKKAIAYINGIANFDYGQKMILYRMFYSSDEDKDTYNKNIVEYLNSRDDISYGDMVSILEELEMTVQPDGTVEW